MNMGEFVETASFHKRRLLGKMRGENDDVEKER